jgi:hypothetical protein
MTAGFLISHATKLKLHKIFINSPAPHNINKYKSPKTSITLQLGIAKKSYFESQLLPKSNNPRKSWNLLKEAANITNKSSNIERLHGQLVDGLEEVHSVSTEHTQESRQERGASSCLELDTGIGLQWHSAMGREERYRKSSSAHWGRGAAFQGKS